VEADLQRFYGVALLDFLRGELSLRRLSVLIHHLPPEAATVRLLSKAETGWDVVAYLLADLYHALTGSKHPARPTPEAASKSSRYSKLRKALEAQKARIGTPNDDA
jgi:hypothetical protein